METREDILLREISELEEEISKLKKELENLKKRLGVTPPICSNCKKIRDEKNNWRQIEEYLNDRLDIEFTHGMCPDCAKKLYPELDL